MNQLVTLVAFALLLCGAYGSPAVRVVGGAEARPGEVPSIAALLRHVPGSDTYSFHCAGALIYPHIVLSAAQCFDDMYSQPASWRVRLGSLRHDSGGAVVSAIGIRKHPDFDQATFEYDIALVNLGGPVTSANTAPVPLPESADLPITGGYAYIAGWGSTSPTETTEVSPILHVANVVISDKDTCETNLGLVGFTVQANHFCTVGSGAGICHNDIGSPIYIGPRIAGVASFHVGCGFDVYPAVYTAVAPFVTWINENVLGE